MFTRHTAFVRGIFVAHLLVSFYTVFILTSVPPTLELACVGFYFNWHLNLLSPLRFLLRPDARGGVAG